MLSIHDLHLLETAVHRAVTERLTKRLRRARSLDEIFERANCRRDLMLGSLAESLRGYGSHWVGTGAPSLVNPLDCGSTAATSPILMGSLKKIARASQYISFHLFDVFDHRRRAIASLGVYRNLTTLPTLVQWTHERLVGDPRHLSLALHAGQQIPKGTPSVQFPVDYCAERFGSLGENLFDSESTTDKKVRQLIDIGRNEGHKGFAENLSLVLGLRVSPAEGASMALAFYLWEAGLPRVGILPYYLRLFAWELPSFERSELPTLGSSVIVGLSCTFRQKVNISLNLLNILDALGRGVASAVAFFGLQLARLLYSRVKLPFFLRHEIGTDLGQIIDKIVKGNVEDLSYFRRELIYIDTRIREVVEAPYLEGKQDRDLLGEPERSNEMWWEMFSDMCVRSYPSMRRVTLVFSPNPGGELKLDFTDPTDLRVRLKSFALWPAPIAFNRSYLRMILANLVKNANEADATKIELRFHYSGDLPRYLDIDCWDDGNPMSPQEDRELGGLGLPLIRRTIRSLGGGADFATPPVGAEGPKKVFRVRVPLSSLWIGETRRDS